VSLTALFQPRSIAVIGATPRDGSVARAVMENLRSFAGPVWGVNPKYHSIADRPVVSSLAEIGQDVDLAIIITPSVTVPGLVRECVQAGVKGLIIISAGFREIGSRGIALEQEILAEARRNGIRIIGPNCLGLMVPGRGLNATFATQMASPGRVAFLSQSGALCTAILDWSLRERVGFSAFVSVGSMLDVGWADLIQHFGDDPHTDSIVIYMESIGDAQAFLSAAREVAQRKPIVVIKVGRTAAAAHAAASHTGAMTGSDAVLDAALRQNGVLRVDTIEELFDLSEILAKQPLPTGPRLAIVTNAGGPGALAVDALVGAGGTISELSLQTLEQLSADLPPHWSHGDPVDILGDADAARYASALQVVAKDPSVDGLLVILTPQAMTCPTEVAEEVAKTSSTLGKPVLASWMGGHGVREGRVLLNQHSIPTYDYPDQAARAFVLMWERSRRLEWLAETKLATQSRKPFVNSEVMRVITDVRSQGRALLTEAEAKLILKASGIPVVETHIARTADEAAVIAIQIGFPVVVKLHSLTLTHKSDIGGVKLGLTDAEAVRKAWSDIADRVPIEAFDGVSVQRMVLKKGIELILGASTDPQFGPVLLFGSGGTLVEVYQDRALALPPLTLCAAKQWMAQTRIHRALLGVRGDAPVDLDALAAVLVRFADLIAGVPEIAEADINPLLATPEGVLALDARIVLRP
jgi:acetyltransferase